MSAPTRQESGRNDNASWPKAIAGILFLVAIMSFGTWHSMPPGRMDKVLFALGLSSPTSTPTATLTFDQWEDRANAIDYESLVRQPEKHEGKLVTFRGKVLLILEQTNNRAELLVFVEEDSSVGNGKYGTLILHCRDMPYRVVLNDMISVVAIMDGINSTHQVPELTAMALKTD